MSYFARSVPRSRASVARQTLDFTTGALPAGLSCTRNSVLVHIDESKLASDLAAACVKFAANAPVLAGTLGLYCVEAFTEYGLNMGLTGAVVGVIGSGGVIPTGWALSGGATREIVDKTDLVSGIAAFNYRTSGGVNTSGNDWFCTSTARVLGDETKYLVTTGILYETSASVYESGSLIQHYYYTAATGGSGQGATPQAMALSTTVERKVYVTGFPAGYPYFKTNHKFNCATSPYDWTQRLSLMSLQVNDWPAARPVVGYNPSTSAVYNSPAQVVSGALPVATRIARMRLTGTTPAGIIANQTLCEFTDGAGGHRLGLYRSVADNKIYAYDGATATEIAAAIAHSTSFDILVTLPASLVKWTTVHVGHDKDAGAPFRGYLRRIQVNPGSDRTPDDFTLTAYTSATPSAVLTRSVTITGIDDGVAGVFISGAGRFRIAGGAWKTAADINETINTGQTLEAEMTALDGYAETTSCDVTVGTVTKTFTVTTAAAPANASLNVTNWPRTVTFTPRVLSSLKISGNAPADLAVVHVLAEFQDDATDEIITICQRIGGGLFCTYPSGRDVEGNETWSIVAVTLGTAFALPGITKRVSRVSIGADALGGQRWTTGTITELFLDAPVS